MTALRNSLILIVLLSAVSCDTSSELNFGDTSRLHSISYLKSLCKSMSADITTDIDICGTVTANDLFGEFYKSIVIADESGGIEIAIDNTRLAADYPVGSVLIVRCNGLSLGRSGGSIQLGKHPTGEYTVDRIPQNEQDRYIGKQSDQTGDVSPHLLTIAELSPQHISSYIMLDRIRFSSDEQGLKWCDRTADTTVISYTDRHIIDMQGDTLTVRTSYRCIYANEPIPEGIGSICGIADYAGGKYLLRITNRSFNFTQ